MAFSVRNMTVENKARTYAVRHGMTLTGALDHALDKAMCQEDAERKMAFEEWIAPIRAMQAEVATIPDSGLTEDEIMGWDENGLPN